MYFQRNYGTTAILKFIEKISPVGAGKHPCVCCGTSLLLFKAQNAKAEVPKFPLPCPRQARTQRALGQHPKFGAVTPIPPPWHKGGALLTCRAQGAVQKV